jgi:hypothetical protein
VNALCWERPLPGDYAEVVAKLGPGEGIVSLDEDRLRSLKLTAYGLLAIEQMLGDLALLRDAGRDPARNIIYGYPRDEEGGPVPTDVASRTPTAPPRSGHRCAPITAPRAKASSTNTPAR